MIGLFIGPTLLAVALTMLRHWLRPECPEPKNADEDCAEQTAD